MADGREELTELVFILDRSGSMSGLEGDTIGGFNGTIGKQRTEKGEALVTTVLFDDRYEMLSDRIPIECVKKMTDKEYWVRGCTALLDAIGRTIRHVASRQKAMERNERPARTIVVIITDGLENASRYFSRDEIKRLIGKEKTKHGWEFLFLGANMDAICEAERLGIESDRAVDYLCDEQGTGIAYESISCAMSSMRSAPTGTRADGSWKNRVERDMRKRGRR